MYNLQVGLVTPHGSDLSVSIITERTVISKYDFEFLLFLKLMTGISGNTL